MKNDTQAFKYTLGYLGAMLFVALQVSMIISLRWHSSRIEKLEQARSMYDTRISGIEDALLQTGLHTDVLWNERQAKKNADKELVKEVKKFLDGMK